MEATPMRSWTGHIAEVFKVATEKPVCLGAWIALLVQLTCMLLIYSISAVFLATLIGAAAGIVFGIWLHEQAQR